VKPFETNNDCSEESVPWCTTVPLDSRRILSMVERILKLGWCIDKITVRWREIAIDLSVCITLKADELSRPDVGSSRSKTAGSWRRLMPIETRLRSPPDRPCASLVFAKCPSLSSARREEIMVVISDVLGTRRRAAKAKVSDTVSNGRHASCWGT